MTSKKLGLVLSGGGAKGAYEVGVLKALAELDLQVDMVAGASIGALNGALVASSPSLSVAADRLHAVWKALGSESPLKLNIDSRLLLWMSFGLTLSTPLQVIQKVFTGSSYGGTVSETEVSVLKNSHLSNLLDEYLDFSKLHNGLPFYVSLYKSEGSILDSLNYFSSQLGRDNGKESRFIKVNDLDESERKAAVLGSAALPFLFTAQSLRSVSYRDGSIGGSFKSRGNTPAKPLVDAGCSRIVVVHLDNGSLWDRNDYPHTAIAEIRPNKSFSDGEGMALLDFSARRISELVNRGYTDTLEQIGDLKNTLTTVSNRIQSESMSNDALHRMTTKTSLLRDHPYLKDKRGE